ncbi:MAG: hypothetical protein AAFX52_11025 [Pseudomonadota bacterium]
MLHYLVEYEPLGSDRLQSHEERRPSYRSACDRACKLSCDEDIQYACVIAYELVPDDCGPGTLENRVGSVGYFHGVRDIPEGRIN